MELGELEFAVLKALRELGEGSPGEIYRELRKDRDVAYTSVTTTLYRLVDKDMVAVRRESEKRMFYRVKEGRAYRAAVKRMVDRIVGSFGDAAVSYLLSNQERVSEGQLKALKDELEKQKAEGKRG